MDRGSDAVARNGPALDWVNLLLADVQDGLGPFLAIYLLTGRHWAPGAIGTVMTVSGIATVLARTPVGGFIDRIAWKRELVMVAAAIVGLGASVLALLPQFWPVAVAQAVTGAANAVFPPALAAITLGIVGRRRFTRRIGRNESFNHAGNAATATLAGLCGYLIAPVAVIWVVAALAAASVGACLLIRRADIDDAVARGGSAAPPATRTGTAAGIRALLADRDLVVFAACITLFHFANAAMLPLAGEVLARSHPAISSLCIAACIIAAQIVMVPVTAFVGRHADGWGRKTLFLIGFAALPVRGLLYTLTSDPYAIVAIQLLDGIGAGAFSVLFFVVVEDLTEGTGRYGLAQGLTSAAWGFGAALSNLVAGYVAEWLGYDTAFLMLAGIAAAALALFWVAMPETSGRGTPGAATHGRELKRLTPQS